MLLQHSISTVSAQKLKPIYNITVHEIKIIVALNVAKIVGAIRHQYATRVEKNWFLLGREVKKVFIGITQNQILTSTLLV